MREVHELNHARLEVVEAELGEARGRAVALEGDLEARSRKLDVMRSMVEGMERQHGRESSAVQLLSLKLESELLLLCDAARQSLDCNVATRSMQDAAAALQAGARRVLDDDASSEYFALQIGVTYGGHADAALHLKGCARDVGVMHRLFSDRGVVFSSHIVCSGNLCCSLTCRLTAYQHFSLPPPPRVTTTTTCHRCHVPSPLAPATLRPRHHAPFP